MWAFARLSVCMCLCVCDTTLPRLHRGDPASTCAADHPTKFEFENGILGNAIPPNFIPACEKGFREAVNAGALIGHPVEVRGCEGWGGGGGAVLLMTRVWFVF